MFVKDGPGGNALKLYYLIGGICAFIILIMILGLPKKAFQWLGNALIKIMIGAVLLFFLNIIGNSFGLYVPINFITSAISGFLGIPGVAALVALQLWIF